MSVLDFKALLMMSEALLTMVVGVGVGFAVGWGVVVGFGVAVG